MIQDGGAQLSPRVSSTEGMLLLQYFLSFPLNIILLIENSLAFVGFLFVYRILEARSSLDSPAWPATQSITRAALQLEVPLSWGLR